MLKTDSTANLEEYYKDPVVESWTYVPMGLEMLKTSDPAVYAEIKRKQEALSEEIQEVREYVKVNALKLNLNWAQVETYLEQFLQKFPLALRREVAWDDPSFIFLYLLTKITKPKVIIETGSNIGFSSSFIALAVKENNNNCKFFTIDPYLDYEWKTMSFYEHNEIRKQKINYSKVTGRCAPLAVVPQDLRERIILKNGYSRDVLPGLLKENKTIDMFFHDSDHGYRNIVWECALALSQLSLNGYLLVHDINLNLAFEQMFKAVGGIAVKENLGVFKKTDRNFSLDGNWPMPSENSSRNDREYEERKAILESSPKEIIIQLGGSCNLNCAFCFGRQVNAESGFDGYYRKLEAKIYPYLARAQRIVFKSCGNFFNSSELERMIRWRINCVELNFPEIEKIYYTNGFDLTPEAIDFILNPGGICGREYGVRNILNVLLYASNSKMYKILTRSDEFDGILRRIEHLMRMRQDKKSLKVIFSFLATTLNIEDLPEFIKLAARLGADKVECNYAYIYAPGQKYLSCFFKQKMTNAIFQQAELLAGQLKLDLCLPPKFGQSHYPAPVCCRNPWERITLNACGDILVCNSGLSCQENIEGKSFMDGWNGAYYQDLRKEAAAGGGCAQYCFEANPACVNDFCAHVHYGKSKKPDIDILWADNF